jgi:hypothetical protein
MPHSKFVGSAPKDLAKVFAKEPCDCFAHHCARRLSEFAPLYAATVGCQLGSEPQSVLETRVIAAKKLFDKMFEIVGGWDIYVTA